MKKPQRLLRLPEVMARAGLRHALIYKKMGLGTFPQVVKIGKAACWVEAEIEAWIDEQIAARNSKRSRRRAPAADHHAEAAE